MCGWRVPRGSRAPASTSALHLQVSTAEVADAASYMCVAENQAGSAEKLFTLRVQGERRRAAASALLYATGTWAVGPTHSGSQLGTSHTPNREHLGVLVTTGLALGGFLFDFGGSQASRHHHCALAVRLAQTTGFHWTDSFKQSLELGLTS